MADFDFRSPSLPAETAALRAAVRAFVAAELPPDRATIDPLFFADPDISRKIGKQGWIGMTWPKKYGGQGLSALHRYVVLEELLAAGVPMAAHLTADRQSGPLILRFGTEAQRLRYLPRIAAGECYFCIGLSEPDAGSDLSAVRTRAYRTESGWRINGTKVWTSNAHGAHYMIALVRTEDKGPDRHGGLTQFIIDLTKPGLTINPIVNMAGSAHFNEVVFQDFEVTEEDVIGALGAAWSQLTAELALERSGPERLLSSYRLLVALVDEVGTSPRADQCAAIGRLVAHGATLRQMSVAVNAALEAGHVPNLEAAFVKDLGTNWEQEIAEVSQGLVDVEPDLQASNRFQRLLGQTLLQAPSFSLRGGTREIVRSIVARGLGLR